MIEASRLILRPWTKAGLSQLSRISNTQAVMAHLGGVAEEEKFHAAFERAVDSQRDNGFCLWLMERRRDHALLGLCGLKLGTVGPIDGEIEIGWRIAEEAWGQGYAREAASASLDWAWAKLARSRIFAVTVAANTRSWGLMERLGMQRHRDLDFDHPTYTEGHPLRPHITYVIERPGRADP